MQCISPITIKNDKPSKIMLYGRTMQVPCGRCPACIDNKRKAWYVRLKQEVKHSFNAFFVTLTYAPDALPRNSLGYPTFDIPGVQKFLKRVRKELEVEQRNSPYPLHLRYFLIGEYGSKKGRPHYHAIFFNIPDELDLYNLIREKWGQGRISVSRLCEAQIGYCANYMYGKSDKIPDLYVDDTNKIPLLTSRRPGIGANYLSKDVIEWHLQGNRAYYMDGKIKYCLPRFYKDKIFVGYQEKRKLYKENYARILEKKYEQYLEDKAYTDRTGDYEDLPSKQRIEDYKRKFYSRVKKHQSKEFNYEHYEYF